MAIGRAFDGSVCDVQGVRYAHQHESIPGGWPMKKPWLGNKCSHLRVAGVTSGRGYEWQGLRVAGPSKYANMCPPGGHPTMPNSIHGIPNTSLVSVKHRLLQSLIQC